MNDNARNSAQRLRRGLGLLGVAAGLMLIFLPASQAQQDYDSFDPPTRVARVNYLNGSVSFQPGGVDDWVDVNPNRPLSTGDALWVDADSRAELHIGSTAIRLNQFSSFALLNLSNDAVQMQLTSGSLDLRVRHMYPGENYEVDTPNLAFTALQEGDYRIDTDPDSGTTAVTVRNGEGEITGGGQSFYVDPGTQAQVSGTDQIYYDIYDLPQPDRFDSWASQQDHREDRFLSARYVSRDLTGYEALDQYGSWVNVPNLGFVWQPNQLPDGWAPVREGHWAWVDPWGWTWVDDAPWGFVTSHYGRWAYVGGQWAWIPPGFNEGTPYSIETRPVYAPSLVVFLGGGLGFGGGGDGVAWVALGPGEPYIPPYQVSPAYLTRVNVTNTVIQQTTITNVVRNINTTTVTNTTIVYANQRVANAVTAVPKAAFVNAQPVAKAAVSVSAQAATSARAVAVVKVAPVQASVLGKPQGATSSAAKPPASVASKSVVAKATPPSPPVPFAKKQQALAANPGRPLDRAATKTIAAANPAPARIVKVASTPAPVKTAPAQVHKAPPPPAVPAARPGSPEAKAAAAIKPALASNPSVKQAAPPAENKPPARSVTPPSSNKPPAKAVAPPAASKPPEKPEAPPPANKPPTKPLTPPAENKPPVKPVTPPPANKPKQPPPQDDTKTQPPE